MFGKVSAAKVLAMVLRSMDPKLVRVFQHQVRVQCEFIFLAYDYLVDHALKLEGSTVMTFFAIQSLIGSAACIRRAMWGQDASTNARRLPLRQSLATDDSSPINNPDIRNHFEHFDERIEKWWAVSKQDSFLDLNVLPAGTFTNPVVINEFRHYDPVSGDVTFWQHSKMNLPTLVEEAKRIHEIALAELTKPEIREQEAVKK